MNPKVKLDINCKIYNTSYKVKILTTCTLLQKAEVLAKLIEMGFVDIDCASENLS